MDGTSILRTEQDEDRKETEYNYSELCTVEDQMWMILGDAEPTAGIGCLFSASAASFTPHGLSRKSWQAKDELLDRYHLNDVAHDTILENRSITDGRIHHVWCRQMREIPAVSDGIRRRIC